MIELYGVFYPPATLLLKKVSGVCDIFIIVYAVKGKGWGSVPATFIPDLKSSSSFTGTGDFTE